MLGAYHPCHARETFISRLFFTLNFLMPIPSASTSSSTTPTSTFTEPHQIPSAAKPSSSTTPGCSQCSADAAGCQHKPGLAFPTATTIDEKRAKCDRHSTSRSQASPSSMLLTSRKEGDVWVDISNERLPNSRLGSLYPGSCFKGMQHCGTTSYEVSVDIQVSRRLHCLKEKGSSNIILSLTSMWI